MNLEVQTHFAYLQCKKVSYFTSRTNIFSIGCTMLCVKKNDFVFVFFLFHEKIFNSGTPNLKFALFIST